MISVKVPSDPGDAAEIVASATSEGQRYWAGVRRMVMALPPERGWNAILLLIDACQSSEQLGDMGTVVVEAFLQAHWGEFASKLAPAVEEHPGLAGALHSVMLSDVPQSVNDIVAALERGA